MNEYEFESLIQTFSQQFHMSCTAEDVEHLLFTDANLFIITPRNASDTIGRVLCGTLEDDQTGHSIIVNIHASIMREPIRRHVIYRRNRPRRFCLFDNQSHSTWSVKPQSHHFSWISLDSAPPLPLPVCSSSQHECQPKAKAARRIEWSGLSDSEDTFHGTR
jgi:hypothetical protein